MTFLATPSAYSEPLNDFPDRTLLKPSRPTPSLLLLALGLSTPFLAVLILPPDYSFYMFIPATPPDALSQARLVAANCLLVAGALLSVISAAWLVIKPPQGRRIWSLLAPIVVLLHPSLQPVFFESLDTELNCAWYSRAQQMGILGKSREVVVQLLGRPSWEAPAGAPDSVVWNYKPLPIYLLGSKGQVVFTAGRVTYVEANDD